MYKFRYNINIQLVELSLYMIEVGYICYWNLQFLNNVNIIKIKVPLPQA